MTLDYITIPVAILSLTDLNIRQKLILALVVNFNENSLKMSNEALSDILGIREDTVGDLINDMQVKGYVRIENAQSKWRKIYLRENSELKCILRELPISKDASTSGKNPLYLGNNPEQNIKNINNNIYTPKTFIAPLPDEVTDYARTIGYDLDGEYFCDYYQMRGWCVGRQKMRDWQAAVRTWKRKKYSKPEKPLQAGDVWDSAAEARFFDDFIAKNAKTEQELTAMGL
jgi:hypothetical protein